MTHINRLCTPKPGPFTEPYCKPLSTYFCNYTFVTHHSRLRLTATGVQAARPLVSPWSQVSTPAHLRDTSTPSPSCSLKFGNQSLKGSPAELWSRLRVSEDVTSAISPSSEHGHDSEVQIPPFSSSPVTGLCQDGPSGPGVYVRTTLKEKVSPSLHM